MTTIRRTIVNVPIAHAANEDAIRTLVLTKALQTFGEFNLDQLNVSKPILAPGVLGPTIRITLTLTEDTATCPLCDGTGHVPTA